MKGATLIAWLLCISGTLTYVIGLWRACPLLSGKGYFLGVLMTAWFVTWVYLREMTRGQLDERFIVVCKLVALITVGLFCVGIMNAPLTTVEKVIHPIALFVSLLGFVRLIRASV
ncbi:TPA: inner membrane protein YiaB [Citrobacter sedlakii]